jgi:hypothetical protein
MESATTNLSEITADFVRLWDGEALRHKDVRELFVHKQSVVAPDLVELQVGQETDTELIYPAPTNEQVPGLKGLLEYIDARGMGGVVNKHYNLKRKHFTLQEGPVQQVQQHRTLHTHRHEQLHSESHHSYQKIVKKTSVVLLEVFAPVMLVKQVRNLRVTRPIYIFAS